jgi:hypothetical protein
VAAVAGVLRDRDIHPVLIDAAKLELGPYTLAGRTLTLEQDGREARVHLGPPTRGWIRRVAPPRWRRSVELGSEAAAVRAAWTALVTAIACAPEVAWLTPLDRLFLRENKLLQSAVARRLGVPTPATSVVSDASAIPAALGDTIVVKPLGPANYIDHTGEAKVVWTQTINRGSPVLERLHSAPFLLQRHLDAERHLRAVTVGDRVWVCELPGRGRPLDWRRDDQAHDSFVATTHPSVERDALRLAVAFGVGYSSQDWIVTRERAYFLDLNPAGQWLFLPPEVASSVTKAIAAWLTI